MLDSLISNLAPHYCLSCGEIGEQICDNCFFDIELAPREICFSCHSLLRDRCCTKCRDLRDVQQVVLSEREGVLAKLIDTYKFSHTYSTGRLLARLYDSGLPELPPQARIVPLPTAPPHIRQRGFDHTRDIALRLARARQCVFFPIVSRRHNKAQVGVGRRERVRQANEAYVLRRGAQLDPAATYVICDDIVTTGASMTAMVRLLREHGVVHIVCVALLQQPWQE